MLVTRSTRSKIGPSLNVNKFLEHTGGPGKLEFYSICVKAGITDLHGVPEIFTPDTSVIKKKKNLS